MRTAIGNMRSTPPVLAILLGSAVLPAFMGSEVFSQPLKSPNGDLALVGGTIYVSPTEEPIRDGVVLIQRGKIAAVNSRALLPVPQTVPSLDCSGRTITAGFWNSHVHFFERKWADAAAIPAPELNRQLQDMFTRYGFTSVFDLSSMWENTRRLRGRIESTTAPAGRFGESTQPGRIAAGFQADLAVLKDDPSKDARSLAAVQYTLRAGKIIFRASECDHPEV
jgi:N-acetylglucosamine-6-phosphate deacetylase